MSEWTMAGTWYVRGEHADGKCWHEFEFDHWNGGTDDEPDWVALEESDWGSSEPGDRWIAERYVPTPQMVESPGLLSSFGLATGYRRERRERTYVECWSCDPSGQVEGWIDHGDGPEPSGEYFDCDKCDGSGHRWETTTC